MLNRDEINLNLYIKFPLIPNTQFQIDYKVMNELNAFKAHIDGQILYCGKALR